MTKCEATDSVTVIIIYKQSQLIDLVTDITWSVSLSKRILNAEYCVSSPFGWGGI